MPDEILCARCNQTGPRIPRAPLRNELGERILGAICANCWAEWLRYQTALINHYALDVREPRAREFLTANMEAFFFRTDSTREIDAARKGTVGPEGAGEP